MQPEPTGWKFVTCLTANTEYQVPKNGTYRITCIGKSGDGATGGGGRTVRNDYIDGTHYYNYYYGGSGGNGGGAFRAIINKVPLEQLAPQEEF